MAHRFLAEVLFHSLKAINDVPAGGGGFCGGGGPRTAPLHRAPEGSPAGRRSHAAGGRAGARRCCVRRWHWRGGRPSGAPPGGGSLPGAMVEGLGFRLGLVRVQHAGREMRSGKLLFSKTSSTSSLRICRPPICICKPRICTCRPRGPQRFGDTFGNSALWAPLGMPAAGGYQAPSTSPAHPDEL